MDYGGLEKKLKSLSKRMDEFLQALIDEQRRKEEVRGCYRRSAKRKGRKEERKKKMRGRNVLEFGGSDRKEKKKEGKKEKE